MAAAIAPVNVMLPAGAPQAHAPLLVDANDQLVALLPWMPWDPAAAAGGVPCVSLALSEALLAFSIKNKLDRTPADVAAMHPVNAMTLRLTANAWSRIMTAVRDNGLAAAVPKTLEDLHNYIRDRVPITAISAADWALAPALGPGANAAHRAQSLLVRYLSLATVGGLEVTAETNGRR